MRNRNVLLTISTLTLAVAAGSALAVPFSSPDPRSLAMGGAGVAAGSSANAVFLNPALLALKRDRDRFSLELPIVSGRVLNQGDVIDALEDFDDTDPINRFDNAIEAYQITQNETTRNEVIDAGEALIGNFRDISNKVLQLEGNAAAVIGVPGKRLGISVFANASVVGGVIGDFTDLDEIERFIDAARDNVPIVPGDSLALTSTVRARFAVMSEVGVGLARNFDWLGGMSLGVTPKLVKVQTYDYAFVGSDIDDVEIDIDQNERSDTDVNFDIGLVKDFGLGWQAGLTVRNVIPRKYDLANTAEHGDRFELEPMARAGVVHRPPFMKWVTFAADLDLTENKPAGLDTKTQYLGLGVEFDALRTLQLRLGYRHNLSDLPAGVDSGTYSAGIGFSPLGFHVDAALAGNSDDFGAALQLGFRF